METYHKEWPNPTPPELAWIYPDNKRLPKEFRGVFPEDYKRQLETGDLHEHVSFVLAISSTIF